MAQEIPCSIIKGSGFYNIDLGNELTNKGGKVLLITEVAVIIGLGDLPYILSATPRFNIDSLPAEGLNRLPENINETLHEVEEILIKSSFTRDQYVQKKWGDEPYPPIPSWVIDYKKLLRLRLNNIDISNLAILIDLPLAEIEFQDVKFDNKLDLVGILRKFKQLKTIACDDTFPTTLRDQVMEFDIGIKELPKEREE